MSARYVLEDGGRAEAGEVMTDEKGVLRHKDGRAVKMRPNGVPLTSGATDEEIAATREVETDTGKGKFKNRESRTK